MATAIPRKPRSRASHTRERILAAALAAFGSNGYKGTSLNSIVASSGLTKGAFYHHFRSKDELAFACHDHLDSHLVRRLDEAAHDASTGITRVRAILDAWIRVLATEPEVRALGDLPGSYPKNEVTLLATAIAEARSEHELDVETDDTEFARLLWVLVESASRAGQQTTALGEQCVSLVLRAVTSPNGPSGEWSRFSDLR